MPYGLPELKTPDLVGDYARGSAWKEAKDERSRKQPIIEQLEKLNIRKGEQAIKAGERNITLKDMAIANQKEKQASESMADIGKAAAWADTPEKWEQALDFFEGQKQDVSQFRGNFQMRSMVSALNNPDYAKQQQAQQNLMKVIETMPEDRREKALAIGTADPRALYKSAAENLYAQDPAQLDALVDTLPEPQKNQVLEIAKSNLEAAINLANTMNKEQRALARPEKVTAPMKKAASFATRMENAEELVQGIQGGGYDPSSIEKFVTTKLTGNWMASPEGQQYWNAAQEWARAKLRFESGAVIGKEEAIEEARVYFPVLGDSKEVILQKKQLRDVAAGAIQSTAGGAFKAKEIERSAVDQEALDWANNNPDDPRAAKIKSKLGDK